MIHAQLCLAVLEGPLDSPPAKGHPQQHLRRSAERGITDKIFNLVVIERVSGIHSKAWAWWSKAV
jgi:hypothetical protein